MPKGGTRLLLRAAHPTPTTQCYVTALVTAIVAITISLSGHALFAIVFGCSAVFFVGSAIAIGLRRAARLIDRADSLLEAPRREDLYSHDLSLQG